MRDKSGYQVTTYRFRLYCDHENWIEQTREIYNQVLEFYYGILQKEPELKKLNRQKMMRQLELWTIGGKKKEEIRYPVPFGKVPLYFRRAAINDAIRLYRSYQSGVKKDAARKPAGSFLTSPIFYKGMYKELSERSVRLKLWNGEKWTWTECGLNTFKRSLPEPEKILSPVLKIEKGRYMLHLPVKEKVEDIRTVQERLEEEPLEKICSLAFPTGDCLAVLTVLNRKGEHVESLFLHGGKQMEHEKKKLLNRLYKNRANMGLRGRENPVLPPEGENKALREKIRNVSDHYAHKISRQIVDFCKERQITILAVPNYRQSMDLNAMGYLQTSSYDWIGRRIIQYLRYKAFGEGIMVASVSTKGIAASCHICGEPVKRFNKDNYPSQKYYGGKNYICPNGHRGNAYFNTAMNVGMRFLKSQAETLE